MTTPDNRGLRALHVQHACPRCRSAIELSQTGGRCAVCGFQIALNKGIYCFVEPNSTADEWHRKFDELAAGETGDTPAGLGFCFPVQHRYLIEAFRQACGPIATDARVLDVGCGNGLFSAALSNSRVVAGVDFSLNMCLLARKRGLIAYQANALALPFAEAQFDLVYSSELAQCIDDLAALLAELGRVCDTGGRVVISTLNGSSLIRRAMRVARKLRPHPAWGAIRPVVMRTAADIAIAARDLPLRPDAIYWTHFPLPWLRHSGSVHNGFDWAASNVVVRFIKQASASSAAR
jgi:SAM-dependent methyltransferase